MSGLIRPAFLPAAMLALAACGSPTDPVLPDVPYATAGAVLDSLEAAYNSMNLESYLACFRDDFEFHPLEMEWDDYDGDGINDPCWGLDLETSYHEAMFALATGVELSMEGTEEAVWSGDSTGASLMLPRTFDLMVYTDSIHSTGYHASGFALFICRQDEQDAWYVWQWFDMSELKRWAMNPCSARIATLGGSPLEAFSWGYIKAVFSTRT
jgi:hypothetical protein